uniref:hypothetical protein n=1 Tax=Fuscoporia viticola TaxID=139386 RepID=UPI0023AA5003|nr:hypothetical protein P1Q19_mgp21 [Fuscoporia viticola]WCF76838.1 hypothetical protein [Fuscoporia viticola]
MIISINTLFRSLRLISWKYLRDSKKLRGNARVIITLTFFIHDSNLGKMGKPKSLNDIPDDSTPLVFTFIIKKKDAVCRDNLIRIVAKHLGPFKFYLEKMGYIVKPETSIFIVNVEAEVIE